MSVLYKKVRLHSAACAVDLGNGSERGEYVNQDYILQKLGRPHRCIQLMYCYFPNDQGWPNRVSDIFESTDKSDAWGYPYDDYFPYEGGPDGSTEGEPFQSMRDIRRHGQDISLTLTIDCGVSDEHLICIAQELKPFGRMRLRINHEATGTWFANNKRYSYQEVADFFVRFHKILKVEAPNVQTILCTTGISSEPEAEASGKVEYEAEFTEAIRVADIWSVDRYLSLHWTWPNDLATPGVINHLRYATDEVHDFNRRSFERFRFVNGGTPKPTALCELNADGNVNGGIEQAEQVEDFYYGIERGEHDFYSSVTLYQFRDRGRLGLEQEDPNNANVGIEQPVLSTYRDIINRPHFQPAVRPGSEINLPAKMRWGGSEDAEGISIEVALTTTPVFFELYFNETLNLMIEVNGRWFYKASDTRCVDIMPAFWDRTDVSGKISINLFAPPAEGVNQPTESDDWIENHVTELHEAPEIRIHYHPIKEEPAPSSN